jgi:hypothetical protein
MVRTLEAVGATLAERLREGASSAAVLTGRGAESVVPVLPPLLPLFPGGGLRKGSTVAVSGSASLLLALLAGASQSGSWCAAVGVPSLGAVAAAEIGVVLERLAFVPRPGAELAAVVAALIDGVDVVVIGQPSRLHVAEVRRLVARARQRGSVLVGFGGWHGADVRLSVAASEWRGLGAGSGHLRARQVRVRLEGRGSAARPRQADVWLPCVGGGVSEASTPSGAGLGGAGLGGAGLGGAGSFGGSEPRWAHEAAV